MGRGKRLHQCGLRVITETLIVDLANRLHRQAAGFLTALVSAHTVGNHGESALALKFCFTGRLPIKKGVLVVFALAANIAQAGHFNSGFHIHAVDRHFSLPTYQRGSDRTWQAGSKLLPEGPRPAMCPAHYRQESLRKSKPEARFPKS